MAKSFFVIDVAQVDILLNQPPGFVWRHLNDLGNQVKNAAKMKVGKGNGKLAASIHLEHTKTETGAPAVAVGSNLSYALLHHEGTRPHIIMPQRAKVLRLSSKGRVSYSRVVHHPGTKPNRYLTDSLRLIK
jgi:hypothetical protein